MFWGCLCQELGAGAFALLTAISHTEDAARYRRAVTFYNSQLMMILGMSLGQLVRAREKSIDSGWLQYVPGGKSKAGTYWVTIPEHAQDLGDHPTDEGGEVGSAIDTEAENETQTKHKRKANAHLSSLLLLLRLTLNLKRQRLAPLLAPRRTRSRCRSLPFPWLDGKSRKSGR